MKEKKKKKTAHLEMKKNRKESIHEAKELIQKDKKMMKKGC